MNTKVEHFTNKNVSRSTMFKSQCINFAHHGVHAVYYKYLLSERQIVITILTWPDASKRSHGFQRSVQGTLLLGVVCLECYPGHFQDDKPQQATTLSTIKLKLKLIEQELRAVPVKKAGEGKSVCRLFDTLPPLHRIFFVTPSPAFNYRLPYPHYPL